MTAGDLPELDRSTQLALERTRLALERTTMAWIRTSTSLIAFGFTIFQFLGNRRASNHDTIASPQLVGVTMILIGIVTLVLANLQHRQQSRAIHLEDPNLPYSLAGVISGLIMVLGLLALVAVVWRL